VFSFLSSLSVALIPLSEFSEPTIAKKYGVKPDAETLDMLNTVARQKEVITTDHHVLSSQISLPYLLL
jgi:hypothetical protein